MVLKIGYAKINKSPGTLPENFGQKIPLIAGPIPAKSLHVLQPTRLLKEICRKSSNTLPFPKVCICISD